ncbi:MAG TPA: dihydrodipicolinate synthase family protein [Verrucomicrobiae bacterium]
MTVRAKHHKNGKYHGAVVPLVTPLSPDGGLDEPALERLVDSQLAGGVAGIFVLGTTGEGMHAPRKLRQRIVELTVRRAAQRALVFAGLGDVRLADLSEANQFLHLGADAVVAHPPISEKVSPEQLAGWYRSLLSGLQGPLLLYNMPMTTGISIPLDAVEQLLGHPKLAGIKDSENNPKRLQELLGRFGGKEDFSVFVGVGALMEQGLKLGADGIVPSVGNLIPDVCSGLCAAARKTDWAEADKLSARMNAVAALYQKGRNLNESLSALKAAMHLRGICAARVLPPLRKVSAAELEKIRRQMDELCLLDGV